MRKPFTGVFFWIRMSVYFTVVFVWIPIIHVQETCAQEQYKNMYPCVGFSYKAVDKPVENYVQKVLISEEN